MGKEYRHWIELAESDIATAQLVLDNRKILPAISIYHSHQCVEKILKAVLAKHQEPIPKIHNINFLLNKSAVHYSVLSKFDDLCAELNTFLPKLRYPIDEQLTASEAKACMKIAKKIYQAVLDLIK